MFESFRLLDGERLAESEQAVPKKEQKMTWPLSNIISSHCVQAPIATQKQRAMEGQHAFYPLRMQTINGGYFPNRLTITYGGFGSPASLFPIPALEFSGGTLLEDLGSPACHLSFRVTRR